MSMTPDPADPGFRGPDVPMPPVPTAGPQYARPEPDPANPANPPGAPGLRGQGYPPAQGADGVSIAALVTGILGLALIPLALGIAGVTRTGPGRRPGRGMAIAGIVLGAVASAGWILAALLLDVSLTS